MIGIIIPAKDESSYLSNMNMATLNSHLTDFIKYNKLKK